MTLGASGCDLWVHGDSGCGQWMWSLGVISRSSGCDLWVEAVDVVSGCGQWVVDILFTSMKYPYSSCISAFLANLIWTFHSIFVNCFHSCFRTGFNSDNEIIIIIVIAAIALSLLTTHPQLWVGLLIFIPKCTT